MPYGRNFYQTLDLGMNLCSWCPERHDKAVRDIRRAVKSPCPGILTAIYILPTTDKSNERLLWLGTQGDLESEYNTPFLSSLSLLIFSFFH